MVQNLGLSTSARHSTWYKRGRSRILLDILHGTAMGALEFFSIFYMVHKRSLSCSFRFLHCTVAVAEEFYSIFYMVENWEQSSSTRHSTWY